MYTFSFFVHDDSELGTPQRSSREVVSKNQLLSITFKISVIVDYQVFSSLRGANIFDLFLEIFL